MKRIWLSEPARDDLLSIWEYVADQSGVPAADKLTAQFKAAFRRLARTPNIAHARADLIDPGVRFYAVHRFLIAFRVANGQLQVLRIVHGARDLAWLLTDPPADEP